MLHATRTLNRRSPRMVKRRNSPYASHDRNAKTRVPIDCTPQMAPIAAHRGSSQGHRKEASQTSSGSPVAQAE